MIHPMWGYPVVCAGLDGQQHDQSHQLAVEACDVCEDNLLVCETCHGIISCCYCCERHALECPWPL